MRRLRSETRLRAQCGRRVTLPMAARRRKVHSPPFPPGGENCVRSLAPPLPGKPASLGFAGNNEGLGKTPPDLLTTGGPRASPTQSQKIFLRIVGEGLKVNCPEGAREATPGCAPPPNREGSCRGRPLRSPGTRAGQCPAPTKEGTACGYTVGGGSKTRPPFLERVSCSP